MQRAAVSIPSNIAEGAERGGREFVRYPAGRTRIPLPELRTQCYIAAKVGLLTSEQMKPVSSLNSRKYPKCLPASLVPRMEFDVFRKLLVRQSDP